MRIEEKIVKNYICEKCGKTFYYIPEYDKHEEQEHLCTHTAPKVYSFEIETDYDGDYPILIEHCNECDKELKRVAVCAHFQDIRLSDIFNDLV